MRPKGLVVPVEIKNKSDITHIAACSCPRKCDHNSVYAIDKSKKVYKSKDSVNFHLNQQLSFYDRSLSIFPTDKGVGVLTRSANIVLPDQTGESIIHHYNALSILSFKNSQKGNRYRNITNTHITRKATTLTLDDGSVIVSFDGMRLGADESYKNCFIVGAENVMGLGYFIDSSILSPSRDKKAHQVTTYHDTGLHALMVVTYRHSKNLMMIPLDTGKRTLVSLPGPLSQVLSSGSDIVAISQENKTMNYFTPRYVASSIERGGEPIPTYQFDFSQHGLKTLIPSRGSLAVGITEDNRVKVYSCRFNSVSEKITEERMQNPLLEAYLPEAPTQVVTTSNGKYDARVNILMEDGKIATMLVPKIAFSNL